MTRRIFVNLPVADVARATAFYEALGFERNAMFSNEQASSMQWSDAMTLAALAAGGRELHDPEDLGFLYSRAFEDPDGHGWGPVYVDMVAATETLPQPAGA